MYSPDGGDGVPAIVMDFGHSSCKAGFSGQDFPQSIFPSVVGCEEIDTGDRMDVEVTTNSSVTAPSKSDAQSSTYYVGDDLNIRRDNLALMSPFRDGLVTNWEAMAKLWKHTYKTLCVDSREQAVMLAEPVFNTRSIRAKQTENMFETYEVPALFISKTAVLSCFANARGTGLVFDSGGGCTTASTVAEGYVVPKGIIKSEMSSRLLDRAMLDAVVRSGITNAAAIRPRYAFRRTLLPDGSTRMGPAAYPKTHASYEQYFTLEVGREMRESLCRCSEDKFNASSSTNIPTKAFALPDGSEIQVGMERFLVPEILFNPTAMPWGAQYQFIPAHTMVRTAIEKCGEQRLRKELFNNIVVAGGNTAYEGFEQRLTNEVSSRAPQTLRTKVVCSGLSERRVTAWIGGSILSSLGSFNEMWISKGEFSEHGSSIVDRKCP